MPVPSIASLANTLFRTVSGALRSGRTRSYTLPVEKISNAQGATGTWRFAGSSFRSSTPADAPRVSQQLRTLRNPLSCGDFAPRIAPRARELHPLMLMPATDVPRDPPVKSLPPIAETDTAAPLLASIARLGALVDDFMPIHPDLIEEPGALLNAANNRWASTSATDSGYGPGDSDWDVDADSDFDDEPELTPEELREADKTFRREGTQVRLAEVAWRHRADKDAPAFSPFVSSKGQLPEFQVESIRAKLLRDADAHVDALIGYDELPRDATETFVEVPTITRG